MGRHYIEAGLLLKKAILTNSKLYLAEACSNISHKEIKRLEQVDSSLLCALHKGHSKTPIIFHHLENGTLMLRHMLMINRLMYHHHIVTRNKDELIYKIYKKTK